MRGMKLFEEVEKAREDEASGIESQQHDGDRGR